MLTSSIVVATSALSGQAATAKQSSTDSKVFLASLCVCLFDFIYFGPVGIREVGRVDQLRFIVLLQHECL
jgi:hypothetical protein